MKYLKKYKIFESVINKQFLKTYEETEYWLEYMFINNYKINKDLVVDVYGDVNISAGGGSSAIGGGYGRKLENILVNMR